MVAIKSNGIFFVSAVLLEEDPQVACAIVNEQAEFGEGGVFAFGQLSEDRKRDLYRAYWSSGNTVAVLLSVNMFINEDETKLLFDGSERLKKAIEKNIEMNLHVQLLQVELGTMNDDVLHGRVTIKLTYIKDTVKLLLANSN